MMRPTVAKGYLLNLHSSAISIFLLSLMKKWIGLASKETPAHRIHLTRTATLTTRATPHGTRPDQPDPRALPLGLAPELGTRAPQVRRAQVPQGG